MSVENPYAPPQADVSPPPAPRPAPLANLFRLLFSFSGRVPRRVYWGFFAAQIAFWIFVLPIAIQLVAPLAEARFLEPLTFAFMIVNFWISLAIQTKRWHDRDKPGLMILVNVIPIAGPIYSLVELGFLRGTVGPNEYGKDPTGDWAAWDAEEIQARVKTRNYAPTEEFLAALQASDEQAVEG